ncbi:hypothetical protein BW41_01131 [Sphingomonas sp. RIT328]|nr:hypothetical protein BW41_01131 [Sphingomonas sp. RIT328]
MGAIEQPGLVPWESATDKQLICGSDLTYIGYGHRQQATGTKKAIYHTEERFRVFNVLDDVVRDDQIKRSWQAVDNGRIGNRAQNEAVKRNCRRTHIDSPGFSPKFVTQSV